MHVYIVKFSRAKIAVTDRPNVVIVVLDCARADDFPGGSTLAPRLPFVDELLRESESYPLAAAVAPWTIPSHASLFTGQYPWEHACHAKSDLHLDAGQPRLSTVLQASGYRTISLSANHLLCDDLGLVDGFDHRAWAGWWEPYLRIAGLDQAPNVPTEQNAEGNVPGILRRAGPLWGIIKRSSRLVYRYPFVMDGVGRIATSLRDHEGPDLVPISPWIEPTLQKWLRDTPRDQPVFAFVNLLETHEPYYPEADRAPSFSSWWRYSRVRQDHVGWLSGEWTPTDREYAHLHEMYRQTYAAADRRLARLAGILRAEGRWDNTLFILTSDHGQAFGEEGMFFHMLRLPEALIRIPLVVRRPYASSAGSRAKGWASLVDVAPTVLNAVGEPTGIASSGVPLEGLLDAPRTGPIFSVADGLVWRTIVPEHEKARFSELRKAHFDRILAAAYLGDEKVVYDYVERRSYGYDLAQDPAAEHDLYPTTPERFENLAEEAKIAAVRMDVQKRPPIAADVEDRLRSWGYI